ncbi:Bro-N domain-containing protein [Victivallis vadensis]|uniref:BRO-N domain-containing protein n=1 Tax=Victivallis vadensis TaxID=172901 RepID=UPI00307DA856
MSNNQLSVFKFEESTPIRSLIKDGEPWFVAKDVCDVLGLTNPTTALSALDEDERSKFFLGRQGNTNIINESGLYALVIRSNKPNARKFRKWITAEVLPAIRKTGRYAAPEQPELPLESAPVRSGRFSALKYRGLEVIPGDELRRRLGITRGQFSNWLHYHRPMVANVDMFQVNGVTDKLAFAMFKAGFKVNPNLITVNLYTRSGFAKAAARFVPVDDSVEVEPLPEVKAELPPPFPVPKRSSESSCLELCLTSNDILKPFDTATGKLLKKLYDAGYDAEREIAEVVFMSGAIRRMRELVAVIYGQFEELNARITIQDGKLKSSLCYERM